MIQAIAPKMVKVSDYIIDFIARKGVKHIFMLPGGGAMHLNDSLGRNKNLAYVCNLHEQACAIAAEAYSQYTNHLGVALVTTGPGGTNTVTGVAGAWLDSTPVLFVSGQVKRGDRKRSWGLRQMGFQEIDIVSLIRPITKYAVTVLDPSSVSYHLEKALYLARHGRPGPVWIDIPLDVQAAAVPESALRHFDPSEISPQKGGQNLRSKVSRAIELLNHAERPVILVGNGVRLANALGDFSRLIERLNLPVLTTWKAADFLPEDHPLYIGRPGAVGQRGANFAQQNADWLLIIGARLDLGQTAYDHAHFAPGAHKIMVDVDAAELRKMRMKMDIPVTADAGDFLREYDNQMAKVTKKDRSRWLGRCKEWQLRYPVILSEYWKDRGFVNDYVLIDALSDALSENDLLIPGSSGACSERTMQAIRVKAGLRIFNCQGLGSMGFGIPAAIGGCLASGGRRTVCLEGDGGFAMNIQELEVVRRLNLPIKFFVLNNQGYASIQATQKNYFRGNFVASTQKSGLTLPDYRKVARAFGIPTCVLKNHRGINREVQRILGQKGPVVCEVLVSPDQLTKPRVISSKRPDGSLVSTPMEDLWPHLDREEFKAQMQNSKDGKQGYGNKAR